MKRLCLVVALLLLPVGQTWACNTADLIEGLNATGGEQSLTQTGRPYTRCNWVTPDSRFIIHFDTTGSFAVYHPNEDINPADGIPDYVNRTAEYFESAYDSLVLGLGFDPPPSDGSAGRRLSL